jgi:hypothetical protein
MSTPDPRDAFHAQASTAERFARVERRLALVEERVGITGGITAPTPQEPAQPRQSPPPGWQGGATYSPDEMSERYTPPAGVVPPHVALNLRALREWATEDAMRALIDVALAGGDVPRP